MIHNLKHTDSTILSLYENHIHVNQGYTRCNLVALNENAFITSISDNRQQSTVNSQRCLSLSKAELGASTGSATEKLKAHGSEFRVQSSEFKVLYIDPKQIKLEGHDHGFFPGCCGVWNNNLIVCGSTKYLKEKEELNKFLKDNNFNLIELYDGELVDVGSIFLVRS